MSEPTPRPSHTTMAGGMVIAGSVLVVVTVGEQLSTLYSLDTRQAVVEFLEATPGTGLDVPGALVLLRVVLMVVAGCATAAAVLGYHALKRSKPARTGLALLAVPLFFGGLATGGFLTALVAASSLLLWLNPSKAWFDGTPIPEPGKPVREQRPSSPWAPPGGVEPRRELPPPHSGTFGAAPPLAYGTLPPFPSPPARRPEALVWACALTWAFSGIVLALLGASLTLLLADSSLVWSELERQNPGLVDESGLTREELLRTTYVTLGVAVLWAAVAIVLAVLAFRRRRAGRLGLVICASLAGVLCVAASFGSVLLVVPALACVATVVLLTRPEVGAWFAVQQPHP